MASRFTDLAYHPGIWRSCVNNFKLIAYASVLRQSLGINIDPARPIAMTSWLKCVMASLLHADSEANVRLSGAIVYPTHVHVSISTIHVQIHALVHLARLSILAHLLFRN